MMIRFNLFISDQQMQTSKALSDATGLGMSECWRRAFDYCTRMEKLQELYPSISGSIDLKVTNRGSR